jgi:FkbM family methyltransferase
MTPRRGYRYEMAMIFSRATATRKFLKRRLRKMREQLAQRFFDTRYGRNLLIGGIGSRVLTMTVDCGDHVMSFSPSDYIGRKIFRKGHFERDNVDRLLAVLREQGLMRKGTTLLELGGNIGTQTIYFALSQAYRRIITVEADPRNFRLLTFNIRQNGLEDRVTAINCAAGDRCGELDFFLHHNNHGKSSALQQNAADEKILVPVRTVPDILERAQTPIDEIGLIWIDIEGYEPVACRSMQALMAQKTPLYMEFTPSFYGSSGSHAFARSLADYYEECIVFVEDRSTPMKVVDLPTKGEQFDVLFMR